MKALLYSSGWFLAFIIHVATPSIKFNETPFFINADSSRYINQKETIIRNPNPDEWELIVTKDECRYKIIKADTVNRILIFDSENANIYDNRRFIEYFFQPTPSYTRFEYNIKKLDTVINGKNNQIDIITNFKITYPIKSL